MFIVIEIHLGLEYATFCLDEEGKNQVFETREQAQAEADECLDAIVVEL